MGFTKLDSGILDSSIWDEPEHIRCVWFAFLAKKDHSGFVATSYNAMRRTSNLFDDPDGKKFDGAIACLESPDPDSRTKDYDGRRIKRCEGGWIVLNHQKYREFTYSDSPEAVRQRRHRNKSRDMSQMSQNERDISVSASVSGYNNILATTEGDARGVSCERAQILFNFWLSRKNLQQHRGLNSKMRKVILERLAEFSLDELCGAIRNYSEVTGDPKKYWYTYSHPIDEFFRAGIQKTAPFRHFLDEATPLTNYLREKAKAPSYIKADEEGQRVGYWETLKRTLMKLESSGVLSREDALIRVNSDFRETYSTWSFLARTATAARMKEIIVLLESYLPPAKGVL